MPKGCKAWLAGDAPSGKRAAASEGVGRERGEEGDRDDGRDKKKQTRRRSLAPVRGTLLLMSKRCSLRSPPRLPPPNPLCPHHRCVRISRCPAARPPPPARTPVPLPDTRKHVSPRPRPPPPPARCEYRSPPSAPRAPPPPLPPRRAPARPALLAARPPRRALDNHAPQTHSRPPLHRTSPISTTSSSPLRIL